MKKLLTLPLPLALLSIFLLTFSQSESATSQVVPKPVPVRDRVADPSARPLHLSLEFEANQGQAPTQYPFVAHGQDYALGISASEIALSLHRSAVPGRTKILQAAFDPTPPHLEAATQQLELHLRLAGANVHAAVSGLDRKPGMSNYFIGNNPANWHTSVPHFARVHMAGVYRGVDLVFYGNPEQLEYDFHVAPGADPRVIALQPSDSVSSSIDAEGNLVLSTAAGDVRLKHPDAYQEIGGVRRPVTSKFRMTSAHTIAFELGAYDRAQPLIIDPVLTYGVSFGGDDGSQAIGVDVDATGNAYVTGNSCSVDFPTSGGNSQGYQGNPAIIACQDAFVLKLDPAASTLIYSDFIGGSGNSSGTHVVVDTSGDAFVTGATDSANFPLAGNIGPSAAPACNLFHPTICPDGFILKLSPDGSSIIFSSLLGGSQSSSGFQAKLNPVTGDLVVLGETDSSDFLPAPTTLVTTFPGGSCQNGVPCFSGFLLGLDPATGSLRYGTFLGGAATASAFGLAFDAAGNTYIAESTQPPLASSIGAATHTYPPAGANAAGDDIVVLKLQLAQNKLSVGYLTFIEGEADSVPTGIAVDASANVYVAGSTASHHLPVTPGVFQSTNNSSGSTACTHAQAISPFIPNACGTVFVGKLDATGALSFLTYLGGSTTDWGEAIGVDSLGNLWITGITSSTDFPFAPSVANPFTNYTPFLAEMSGDGTALPFAAAIAQGVGQSTDVKIDSNNNVYVVGYGYSAPSTPGTYPPGPDVENPMFVQKWSGGPAPAITVSATSLNFGPTLIGTTSASQTLTISNTGQGPLQLGIQNIAGPAESPVNSIPTTAAPSPFLMTNNCGATLAANSSCTLIVSLQPFPSPPNCTVANGCDPQQDSATIVIQNNAPSGTKTVALSGTSGVGPVVAIAPKSVTFPSQVAGTSSATETGTPGSTQYVQVSNLGDISLVLTSATLTGPNAADFQLTNSCTAPLPAGFESSCQLSLVFSPAASATGTRTAALTFVDNAADSPQSIPITGTVATSAPALYYAPDPVVFPYALIGGYTYASKADVDVTNVSSAPLVQVTGVTFTGPNAADFNLVPYGGNGQLDLAPGVEGEIGFYFYPTSGPDGPRTATATLTTNPVIPGLATIPLLGVAATSTDPAISIYTNPSPLDLGSVQVGQTSQGMSTYLLIGNTGSTCAEGVNPPCGGSLIISSIVAGLSDYTVVVATGSPAYCTTGFPLTLPPQSQCGFSVLFAPTQAGPRNTTITINSNDPGGPAIVPVTGVGLAFPLGDLSATALNFGYAAIALPSPPLSVTLQNTSSLPLAISSVSASANFEVASTTCSGSISPGASCTIGVTFTPPTAGAFSGTLTVSDNNSLGGQQTVTLSGIGAIGPSLMILPVALNFPNQVNDTTSLPQPITLINFGDTAVTFPANAFITSSADTLVPTSQYAVSSTTCGSSLAIHASCVVNLEFAPTAPAFPPLPQSEPGTLTLASNARFSPQRVYLSGIVVQTGSNLTGTTLTSSLNPAASGQSITFTAVVAGTTTNMPLPTGNVTFLDGMTMLATIALNSSAQATFSTSSLSPGSHSITAVYSGDANYATSTSTVLSQVVNAPATAATTTTLTAAPNTATVGQAVVLTATVAEVSGSGVPTGTVTFYDGTTSLGTGTLSSGMATYSSTSLAAGTHSITASYGGDPNNAASTSSSVTVTVTAAAPASTATALTASTTTAVSGTAITFTATVTPASGTAVPTGTVTFLDGAITLATGTLNGSGIATYSTSALAVGTHSITAAYGGATNFAASTSTAVSVTITAAVAPGFTLSISPATGTLTAGNSTTATVSVTPAGGFSQEVTLACTGAPANSTCAVTPASVTPSGTTPSTETLTIQTNVLSASRSSQPGSPEPEEFLCGIVLLGWTMLRRRRRSWWAVQLALTLTMLASGAVTGCGSGSASNKTPPGAYTLTVTATAGTITQTATYSLTVQ